MQIDSQKPSPKIDLLKPFQDLYLRLSFNRQQPEIIPYPLSSDLIQDDKNYNLLNIKIDTVLKIASSLILKKKIKLNKFMNVFVQIDHKLVNVFKLKKSFIAQTQTSAIKIKRQDQCFYLNVYIFDVQKMEKNNPLLELTTQTMKYQKIIQKLQKIHEVFTKEIQNLNDEQKSSYDIAYFFAEPLVEPQKLQDFPNKVPIYQNLKLDKYKYPGSDVSFQKEYDKFINVIEAENFFGNITIELMVATQNNIRQVLSERCNILHFSCHGQVDFLKIQKDRNVGYLDALTSAKLIKLLDGKALPKIIIFNACFSRKIASDIHQRFPQITTIGYEGKANDNYCEVLTQKLYSGLYGRQKRPFYQLFQQVKRKIAQKNPKQAEKLYIFKSQIEFKFDGTDFPVNKAYNVNWAYFQNLGTKEPIGIKQKLYEFVQNYLLNNQKTKFFVVGQPESGKSVFIKKALYYTMHRCVFRQKLQIDLRKGEKPVVNMLELKLQYKKEIFNFIKENKGTNFIIVVDHCNDLIRNDPEEFMKFFKKVERQIKLGKLVLVSDNISYFMEINILIDENVYNYEEIIPAKEPKISQDYNTYMNRWHQNWDKKWSQFLKHRICQWFEALRAASDQQNFQKKLLEIKKNNQERQNQKLMVNLEAEFEIFRNKILETQRIIKTFLTSGFYSRNQQCFILLNIFPEFSKNTQNEENFQRLRQQRREKQSYMAQLSACYQKDIQKIINQIIEALGKFHTKNYEKSWWETKLLFLTQKIFVIVGLAILIKDQKEGGEKQIKQQLFSAYTLVMKLFNRYQRLLSELPRLMAQCEALRLRIFMSIYNFYKHYEQMRVKEKDYHFDHNQRPRSEISSINVTDFGLSFNNLLQTVNVEDSKGGNNSMIESANGSEFGFINQRDSIPINPPIRERRESMRSGMDVSTARPTLTPNIPFERQLIQKKQSILKNFEAELKEQYSQTEYWELIQKVTELDTIIRAIQSQESKQIIIDPVSINYNSSLFQFSSTENQRIFETYYFKVEKFYKLHNQVTILYERLESCNQNQNDGDVCRIRKVFFGQGELDLCYLQGLKIISKLIQIVNDEYFFDYEIWYKQKLHNVREKLIKAQKILDSTIARKLNHNRDFSYKKVYKEYLELYIDLRFKLEKRYSSYSLHGEKELLGVFNKLLKLSDDARSIQLKNKVQEFVQKYFYNKCSVLISEPIGYIPTIKHFFANHPKEAKKSKGTSKKDSSQQNDRMPFYPLNIYRTSDMIMSQIKSMTEKKVASQIHIEAEILNFQRLNSYEVEKKQSENKKKRQKYNEEKDKKEEESKKKRLIYFTILDCKQSPNHESFFIENQHGESIKVYFRKQSTNGFPYAPVIILYGSNVELLEQYYRNFALSLEKRIAIIILPTSNKRPEIESQNSKEMFKYVWNEYLEKHIGVSFLSSFWTKFCQIYFDEEHESFKNQVIRSFNIAKQESWILLKKKYLEGLNGSQIQKQIDNIVSKLSLRIQNKFESDEAVNLGNKLRYASDKQKEQKDMGLMNTTREEDFMRSSNLYESVRRQDEILSLNNHEIGCNYEIYEFMKTFFANIERFQTDKDFVKNFIEYHAQINETNMISFAKTLYHKFLRMSSKFQAGIEFKNMEGYKVENNSEIFNVFDEGLGSSTLIGGMGMESGNQIKEEDSMDYYSNDSSEVLVKRQKRVQIYYNVAYKDLKPLIEGFSRKDKTTHQNMAFSRFYMSAQTSPTVVFRILIVDASFIDESMKYYLESDHSCRISNHLIRQSFLENMYHACDTILHYSKRVQGFIFTKIIEEIYNKKNPVDSLKSMSPRQVKDKIIDFFDRHYP